jgi:hydroxymethylpyrimidine/phosphomethylpyrimidine kinase
MPPALVRAQVLAAFDSADIRAIKTGMLANADTINALLACLKQLPEVPLVVDPVLITSSGHSLLDPDGVQQLLAELVPRADIITPNLPEARSLCPASVTTSEALGVQLLSRGPGAVLLKGGHDQGPRAIDLLVQPESPPVRFTAPRLPISMRGTGCMLATGIAAGLARGMDLRSAVAASHQWLQQRFSQACQTNTTLSP